MVLPMSLDQFLLLLTIVVVGIALIPFRRVWRRETVVVGYVMTEVTCFDSDLLWKWNSPSLSYFLCDFLSMLELLP